MLQCVAVCCCVLQCVAVCCSVLQCVAVCCSVCCITSLLHNCIYSPSLLSPASPLPLYSRVSLPSLLPNHALLHNSSLLSLLHNSLLSLFPVTCVTQCPCSMCDSHPVTCVPCDTMTHTLLPITQVSHTLRSLTPLHLLSLVHHCIYILSYTTACQSTLSLSHNTCHTNTLYPLHYTTASALSLTQQSTLSIPCDMCDSHPCDMCE